MAGTERQREEIYRQKAYGSCELHQFKMPLYNLQASLLCTENMSSYLISSHGTSSEPIQSNSSSVEVCMM